MFHQRFVGPSEAAAYQLVKGVFELLQTVDEFFFTWRFGAQSEDALWWTEEEDINKELHTTCNKR